MGHGIMASQGKGGNMGDDLELLTVEEVSELLQVHPDSVRRMMRQGRLPAVKVGWRWYVRRAEFLAMTRADKVVVSE